MKCTEMSGFMWDIKFDDVEYLEKKGIRVVTTVESADMISISTSDLSQDEIRYEKYPGQYDANGVMVTRFDKYGNATSKRLYISRKGYFLV